MFLLGKTFLNANCSFLFLIYMILEVRLCKNIYYFHTKSKMCDEKRDYLTGILNC